MLSGKFPGQCLRHLPELVCNETRVQKSFAGTLGETFKTQFISILGGGHEFLVCSGITGGSNGPFANLVRS